MTDEHIPPGVDNTVPSPARMYDYLLGGTANYEVDRVAAEKVRARMPDLEDAAWANRGFLQRATRWLAERGVRQFVDIGAGLPTRNNTHDAAQAVAPAARACCTSTTIRWSACMRTPCSPARPAPRSSPRTSASPRRFSSTPKPSG